MSAPRQQLSRYNPTNRLWLENGSPRGTFRENFDRRGAASNLTISTGVMLSVAIALYRGDVVTNLSFRSGNVPANLPTSWWFALYDTQSTPALIYQTTDQTTTAWSASTTTTLALSSVYTVPSDGIYYASIMMAAGTPVNLFGAAGTAAASLGPMTGQKVLAQTSGSSLTTTAPATITSASTSGNFPLCYAT